MDSALASENFKKYKNLFRRFGKLSRPRATVLLLACLGAGCASNENSGGIVTAYDPLEPINRPIFAVNQAVDIMIIRPVSVTYRQVVPDPFQDMVTSFLRNLKTPVILLNEFLQGDWEGMEVAATRFFVNTTIGLGGLIDIAGYGNPDLAYRSEDFGQTLAVWGAGEGPYLVIPLLGPSNLRDGAGRIVDAAADPLTYTESDTLTFTRLGLTAVDARSRSLDALDEIERSSIDFYAAIRSLYWQNRRSEVFDGAPPPTNAFPEFEEFEDFEDESFEDGSLPAAPAPADDDILLSEAPPAVTPGVGTVLILDLEPSRESGR